MELRNSRGKIIKAVPTVAGSPAYTFTSSINSDTTYYVAPVVERTQFALPAQQAVYVFPAGGSALANFQVRGIPATLTISGTPGSVVMVSTFAYTSGTPPPMGAGSQTKSNFYTAVIEANGQIKIKVPGDQPYWLKCWNAEPANGGGTTYNTHTGVSIITGGANLPAGSTGDRSKDCP